MTNNKLFDHTKLENRETVQVTSLPEDTEETNKKSKKWPYALLILFLVLAASGSTYYFYHKYKLLKKNPNIEAQKEVQSLVTQVGKLMMLPKDETPTIATVQDKSKVQDQPFFQNAENGDKLLAYTKAMQAILYRPSSNKIVQVAPIIINQPQTPPSSVAGANTGSARVAYYNGTNKTGTAGKAEATVNSKVPGMQTATLGNAKKRDYAGTVVVNISGSHQTQAAAVASSLGAQVGSLPEGEIKPDADILVIVGGQ